MLESFILKIEGLTSQGEGVGRSADGQVVFVAGALPGETVRARVIAVQSRLLRGELLEILDASPQRIKPACGYLAQCGGCNLQHAEYAEQLRLKQQIVQQALQRIGRFPAELMERVKPTLGMTDPWRYRNKVELHTGADPEAGEVRLGYYQPGSHQVIDIADCLLIPAELREILAAVKAGLKELLALYLKSLLPSTSTSALTDSFPLKHLLFRQSFLTGEIALIWVVTSPDDLNWRKWVGEFGPGLLKRFPKIICLAENINPTPFKTVLSRDTRIIQGRPHILEGIGDLRFWLSPVSFYQVNPVQTEILYQQVLRLAQLAGVEKVLDVYCGVGTIALLLARSAAQVIGIEAVAEAVADAKRNAQLNGIRNAAFYKGTAEEWFKPQFPGKQSRGRGKKKNRQKGKGESVKGKSSRGESGLADEKAVGATSDGAYQAADRAAAGPAGEAAARSAVGSATAARVIDDDPMAIAAAGISKIEKMYIDLRKPEGKHGSKLDDHEKPDLIVLNPPRGGCDRIVLEEVSRLFPKWVIYVSCNPATLARDLRFLADKGYAINEIQPVDMFPQTGHVETVVLMSRVG